MTTVTWWVAVPLRMPVFCLVRVPHEAGPDAHQGLIGVTGTFEPALATIA